MVAYLEVVPSKVPHRQVLELHFQDVKATVKMFKARMGSPRKRRHSIQPIHMVAPSYFRPYAECAPSRCCLVVGTVTTTAGHTPGLALPERGPQVDKSLVLELRTHGKTETEYF